MKEKKEKKRRCRRRFMAMLAAVCILNAIPYTGLTVNASENIGMEAEGISEQEEKLDAEQTDTGETENTDTVTEDVGKKEDTGQKEDTKEQDAEDSGQKKEPEEPKTEDSGQTGEKETEEKEESKNSEEPDKKEGLESGEAEETETEEADTEGSDLPDAMGFGETEETEDSEAAAENSEESLMLLAEEAAGNGEETVTDGTYTDENGIVYHYHAYEDGTANLYELESYRGKDVNIPENIDGHAVTQLTFQIWGALPSVTIPETVTYIGEIAFVSADIGTLYYNAARDVQVEQMPNAPFRHTKIGSLVTGENVHIIPAYIFSFAEFQGDITVTAETVGKEAFAFAAFPSLILTKEIKEIQGRAFVGADMQTLYYDTEAEHIMESSTDGMFRGASIQELVIDESITKLPNYVFSYADFCFDEYTVNVERIGAHAFDRAWGSADKCCERLILSDRVNYIGAAAFANDHIATLNLQASAESGASGEYDGGFYCSYITELSIGEDVTVIPDYLFSNAHVTLDGLVLNVESIGRYAFYGQSRVTELTIGENVKEIGISAFADDIIADIHYNAVNAVLKGGIGDSDYLYAPFKGVTIAGISFGEQVTALPDTLFAGADYFADDMIFPDSLRTIGRYAFYSPTINIGTLTIGENMTSIGKEAFTDCTIGVLNYNAIEIELPGITAAYHHKNPFCSTKVGELCIGSNVRSLPDHLFYCVRLTQDELTIPDSVTYIGAEVLSCSADNGGRGQISIGTLTIGEAVSHIGDWAFGNSTYDKAVIYTTKSDSEVKAGALYYLPVCKEVEIHGNSPYYEYFTGRSEKENITLLCEDFETAYGEESYDEEKDSFVTTVTESCVVCGYEKTREERKTACTVVFIDHDGRELSRQHVSVGSAADAPEVPERTGYEFTGWDKSFTNVISDITITAQYERKSFYVSFQDKETIISKQKITYGSDAVLPKEPKRPEEEWGSWKFTGWKGNYRNVMQDEVLQAQFEKVFHEYEVLFYDAEGNILSRQTVSHGADAEVPDAPEKKATAQYSYIFIGWDGDTENVTGNREFHPRYDAVTRFFTVTFVNGEEIVSTQSVTYGGAADAPEEIPEKTGYDFTGWDKDYSNVVSDLTVTAQYKIKTFYVSFKDNETIISKQKIAYGSDAVLPETPKRPEEEWGTWKFTGWDGNYKNIMQDEVLQAQFEKVFYEYEVLFYDAEGNILSRQSVTHGEDAEIPDAPEKKATAQYSYTFTGWDGDTKNITGNSSFYPVYDVQVRSYTVTFLNGDTVLDMQTVLYGKAATAPEDPERAEEVWGTWKFAGWIGDYTNITKDRTIRAQFEKVFKEYEVIFYNEDGNVLSRQTVAYGQAAKAPEAPEKEPTKQHCYLFIGWNGDITNITADAEFYPTYGMETRTYTVTFMNDDAVFAVQEVEYGASAKTPAEPKKEADAKCSYHFTGWDDDYSVITGDTVIHALYDKKEILPKTEPGKEEDTGKKKEESDGGASGGNGGEPVPDAGGGNTSPVTEENSGENQDPVTEDNSGEKPDSGTEGGNAEKQDIVLDILTEEQSYGIELPEEMIAGELPPDMDSETETLIEIPKEEQLSEAMDSAQAVQEEVIEDAVGDDRGMSAFGWFILLIGILLFVFLFLWFLFQSFARRKVCGTVLDESGGIPCGIQLTLSGKDIVEAELGENGSFCFDGLKKEDYRLNVYDADSNKIFSADIRMKGRSGEAAFFILESDCSKIETNRKRGKYEVNLTV